MSVRRHTRLRKEYLYRRSLNGQAAEQYEKKRKLKEALREGKAIPTEIAAIAHDLEGELNMEDANTFKRPSLLDDEYAKAGKEDPKIMITTSRKPSPRLTQFAKEIKLLFPGAQRMNRGNHVLKELIEASRRHGITDVVIVHETRGQPDGLVVSHLPYGPTAYFSLANVVMRHDIRDGVDNMSTVNPHLIFDNFSTPLGKRVETILKYLFPPSKVENQRVVTFSNNDDFISFRHHTWSKEGNRVELNEVGPRWEMSLYKVKLGTIDMAEAQNEWVLNSFTNTSRKKTAL